MKSAKLGGTSQQINYFYEFKVSETHGQAFPSHPTLPLDLTKHPTVYSNTQMGLQQMRKETGGVGEVWWPHKLAGIMI